MIRFFCEYFLYFSGENVIDLFLFNMEDYYWIDFFFKVLFRGVFCIIVILYLIVFDWGFIFVVIS